VHEQEIELDPGHSVLTASTTIDRLYHYKVIDEVHAKCSKIDKFFSYGGASADSFHRSSMDGNPLLEASAELPTLLSRS